MSKKTTYILITLVELAGKSSVSICPGKASIKTLVSYEKLLFNRKETLRYAFEKLG